MRELRLGLYQGDIQDLNLLKSNEVRAKYNFTLSVNVGSTNFIPPDMYAIHFPMKDSGKIEDNDWGQVLELVRLVVNEVLVGGKVLVTCDVGLNRSVIFAAMVISVVDGIPMDDKLMQTVKVAIDPAHDLWEFAKQVLRLGFPLNHI